MSFTILCPGGGDHVLAPPSGQICVCGTYGGFDSGGTYILVRILSGWVDPPDSPWPATASDGKGNILGQNWYATNVPLPSGSGGGAKITVAAWLVVGSGSGSGGSTSLPEANSCYTGGTPVVDTCSICGSGSGSGGSELVIQELASALELEITIPSGAKAGAYRATAVSTAAWEVTIGGVPYRIVCAEGASLLIHGPSSSAPSTSFESDPFSATFPGDMFDADDEIVVVVV